MAAKKRHRCVHCLGPGADTEDHGIPKSWYPKTSAPNVPRIKAPSCRTCQKRLRLVEDELLTAFGMCLDDTDPRCAGVPERVLRSLNPAHGQNDRDRHARLAQRRRVQERAFVPRSSIGELPGFGPQGSPSAVPIRVRAIDEFGEKLTRVMYWAEWGLYIEPSYEVRTHVPAPGEAEQQIEMMIRKGDLGDVDPGLRVAARRASDEPMVGMVACDLWGRFRFYCSVMPKAQT